ncbi:MAG: aminotransferase class I/II-fold pyridoxal phosphate-dependent enzyme [Eubacteriales bacterium]|nr:aminotransferase class I/II-fold pyridoxal phosphate-dependent enzyme [Eubacteriales bacterium]
MFYSFANDYSEGCHPRILNALLETNLEQSSAYGTDHFSKEASELLAERFALNNHQIHFFPGGTPVNLTVMAAFLRPFEGVLAVETGHIAVHEAGAIEATGHKVLTLPGRDGKLVASELRAYLKDFYQDPTNEHMVTPGLIYISQSTELGTLYTRAELSELKAVASDYNLPLFMDGARLAMALAQAEDCELQASDYQEFCDLFYIGGTKCGALLGEALVLNKNLPLRGFRSVMKQRVGLLAKGRILALQFRELFKDDLYLELGAYANQLADDLRAGMRELGLDFYVENNTNQLFPILPDEIIPLLAEDFGFEVQQQVEDGRVARFVTSWATRDEAVTALLNRLAELTQVEPQEF